MADPYPSGIVIEPFDASQHDRTAFSCGAEQVGNYFQKTANKLAKANNVRLYVMANRDGAVIGCYALNAHAVDYGELPVKFTRPRPSYGNIPAAYISMIGRDVKFRGGGYGGDLLVDALHRIAAAADTIGVAVVILDVLDCGGSERVARVKASNCSRRSMRASCAGLAEPPKATGSGFAGCQIARMRSGAGWRKG